MKVNVGGRDGSIGCAQGRRNQKRPQFGAGPRRRLRTIPIAVEVRGDPVTGQIAVIDARGFGIDQGQSRAVDRRVRLERFLRADPERRAQRGRRVPTAECRRRFRRAAPPVVRPTG